MEFDVPEHTQKGGPSGSVLWWCLKSKNEGTFFVGRLTEVEKHQNVKNENAAWSSAGQQPIERSSLRGVDWCVGRWV